jgi:hypothetical protein
MTLRSALKSLLVLALALPVAQCVLFWIRGLVLSMGDVAGAAIIGQISTGCMALWTMSLVGLVIVLAVVAVNDRPAER